MPWSPASVSCRVGRSALGDDEAPRVSGEGCWSNRLGQPPSPPQALGGEPRSLDERLELGPHHRGVLALEQGPLGEAAVGAGDDALAADEAGEVHEALGHGLGVLDHGRGVGDDAGDEHLALGQADVLPDAPLVGVAGVAASME